MRIRGGSGLGDSLYLRPIVEHLVRSGKPLTVMTDYPDVFIGSGAQTLPFMRNPVEMIAHYVGGKSNTSTNIWQDMCAHARVAPPLRFQWTVQNPSKVAKLRTRAAGRRIVLLDAGREPMGREKDQFGREMLPARDAFLVAIDEVRSEGAFVVRIGKGGEVYGLPSDLDLTNCTTVADLLDLAATCDGFLSQCGFTLPMAEALDRPILLIWAAAGLSSRAPFIRTVTPAKMLTKPTSRHVLDTDPEVHVRGMVRDMLAGRPRLEAAA